MAFFNPGVTDSADVVLDEVKNDLSSLKEELNRMDIMFEEARSIMFED